MQYSAPAVERRESVLAVMSSFNTPDNDSVSWTPTNGQSQ